MLVRPPGPHEAESLADLHLLTWQETYAEHFPPSAWDLKPGRTACGRGRRSVRRRDPILERRSPNSMVA
jgi:hypothetical protein